MTKRESATVSYGLVTVEITSDPLLGWVPEWANAREIGKEIYKLIEERHRLEKEAEK